MMQQAGHTVVEILQKWGYVITGLGLERDKDNCRKPECIIEKLAVHASEPTSVQAVIMGACVVQLLKEWKNSDEKISHLERELEQSETQNWRLYDLFALHIKPSVSLRAFTDSKNDSVSDLRNRL